jgi:hypothetical protein
MNIYVNKHGRQYGPYTVFQLRTKVQQGNFTTADLACFDGQNWARIGEVPGFATEGHIQGPPRKYQAVSGGMNTLIILRSCIILEWVLIIPSIALSFLLENHLPEHLRHWFILESERDPPTLELIIGVIFLPLLLVVLTASIGLFFQKKWGIWLYLLGAIFTYILLPFLGPTVEHALVGTIEDLSTLISGLIIGIVLFTNVILNEQQS